MLSKLPKSRIMLTIAGAIASGMVSAASVQVSPTNPSMGIGGNTAASITFTGDAFVTNVSGRINYDTSIFDVTVNAGGTATCTNFDGTGRVTFVTTSGTGLAIPSQTLCNLTFTHTGAAAVASPYTFSNTVFAGTGSADTSPGGNLNVTLGPAAGPAVTYTPAPNAAVGTITFPAATSIGGSTTFDILTAIGAGGANGGQTSVACTGSGNVTFTDSDVICTAGGTCDDTELVASCAATNAAQTGTVTCTETIDAEAVSGDGATTTATRTWGFTCPAANVDPTLTASLGTFTQQTQSLASAPVTVTPAGGSGSGSATYDTCTFSANTVGFAATGLPLTFTGGTLNTAQQFNVTCDPDAAGTVNATMTCSNDGVNEDIAVVCPQEVPRSAPTVAYGAAPAFNTGASVGATATSTTNFTADLSGGQNDNAGGVESASVSCSVTSGPFALGAGTASATNVVAPAAAGNDINVALTCTTPANTAAAGVLTCNYIPTVDGVAGAAVPTAFDLSCPPAPVNLSSNPAPGTISLSGVPGATVGGSIVFSNSGSDAAMTCTATAGTANVQITSNPATVGANSSATLAYTCTAASPGATATGSIQCDTTDPDDFDVVTYNITCNGLVSAPIPAISDFGKVLMVVLVIGLGLVGLGARRL